MESDSFTNFEKEHSHIVSTISRSILERDYNNTILDNQIRLNTLWKSVTHRVNGGEKQNDRIC
jgi:hypothetical protein